MTMPTILIAMTVAAAISVVIPPFESGMPELSVDAPPGFVLVSRKGPDFDVHRLVRKGGKDSDSHLLVYIGHHPRTHAVAQSPWALTHGLKWQKLEATTALRAGIRFEALVTGLFRGAAPKEAPHLDALVVHAIVFAKDPDDAAQLKASFSSIRIKR